MYGAHVKAQGRQQAIKMLYELAEKHNNRFEGVDTNVLPSIYWPPVHEFSVESIIGLCKLLELGEPHLPKNNVDKWEEAWRAYAFKIKEVVELHRFQTMRPKYHPTDVCG
eukprot:2432974-Pleurochrysis_carterae.AAC.1